jgi:hypothetical protein
MLKTTNYVLKKPEGTDVVNIQDFNDNADIIDIELKKLNTSLSEKANTASPTFTGVPLAPTASLGTNNTQVATTAFINNLLGSIGSNLVFANDATFAFRGVSGTMGGNDGWRIGAGATATDGGYLEIATQDNGNEPIYVRQYNASNWGSIGRTLTLLDANGNTTFPGMIVTPVVKTVTDGGPCIYVGNDTNINDCNIANRFSITGQQDATQGGIYFGSGLDTNIYRDSSGMLGTDGGMTTHGTINTTSTGDAIHQLETTSVANTNFRRKQIYSSGNVGRGNTWLFRACRDSDGAVIDYQLGMGGVEPLNTPLYICTTANEPSSKALTGYKKFADGTIIQWGYSASQANGATITFPLAFPNNIYVVTVSANNTVGSVVNVSSTSKTSFTIYNSTTQGIFWMATGC